MAVIVETNVIVDCSLDSGCGRLAAGPLIERDYRKGVSYFVTCIFSDIVILIWINGRIFLGSGI